MLTMTAIQTRWRKSCWGIGVIMITFLAGAWLVVSAYAMDNQRYGTPWTIATTNDFWVGIGLIFVSLVGLKLFTSSLLGTLRAAGFVRPSPRPQAALAPGPGYAPPASPYREEYASGCTCARRSNNGELLARGQVRLQNVEPRPPR